MRATSLVLASALAVLWGYFALVVAPVPVPPAAELRSPADDVPNAASLNNEGVALSRRGRHADALLYFERAGDFRPDDPVIGRNHAAARARIVRQGWTRLLVPATGLCALLLTIWLLMRANDGLRLRRLRLRGEPVFRIARGADRVELPLRFTERVGALLRRHPLTIVWSSSAYGKHMKSRPPVRARGAHCRIELEGERLERLRRYPGDWKGFLYVGGKAVGETLARVG